MNNRSLQRQFRIWTALLVVVPSILIMIIYTVGQINLAKENKLEHINQQVACQERMINYWMLERSEEIRKLSHLDALRALDEQKMKGTLDVMQEDNKNFDSLSYIDKNGFFKISTLSNGIQFSSASGKPYFQAALLGNEYISDVVIGRNSGQAIINFSAPIYDYMGNFQGLLLGSVKTTMLENLMRDNWIGQTGEFFLVNHEGIMITEPRHVDQMREKDLITGAAAMRYKITEDAWRNIQLGESGTATWIDYLGNKVIGAYLGMPERNWTIIGKINEEEVLAPVLTQLTRMAGGTIMLVILIIPLATLLTNRIKSPIDWLIRQSNLVATQNYDLVGQDRSLENIPYELGNLCETFVKMSSKIENTVTLLKENETKLASQVLEIRDINASLEEEVSDRMAAQEALRQLNAALEHTVQERTLTLKRINSILETEISERQVIQEALFESRNELLIHEQQLEKYADEVEATNKELKSFANIIAHDFRSPMVNLKGFSQELGFSLSELKELLRNERVFLPEAIKAKMDELLDKDVPDAQQYINSAVDRLSRMVDVLLNLARLGRREMKYTEIDVGQLTNNILSSFNHQIEQRGIQVEIGLLPVIETDEMAMEQIIGNLLDNAIKFLEPGRPGEISISYRDNDAEYIFSIKDNGRGIALTDFDKIFEVFRRAGNQNVPGEGMGLAYVRTLVRQIGGKVWCESEITVGTKMIFTVPKVQSPGGLGSLI